MPAAAQDSLSEQVNAGTVAIAASDSGGTSMRMMSELAFLLDQGYQLRVLPLQNRDPHQALTNLMYLKGVDLVVVQEDVLEAAREAQTFPRFEQRLQYVTKLYDAEIHVLAGPDIRSLDDLVNRRVNLGVAATGAALTGQRLFESAGIAIEATSFDDVLALAMLQRGEIDAMVYVGGKPVPLLAGIPSGSGLHLLPVAPVGEAGERYRVTGFAGEDYPNLLAPGQSVPTLAVDEILAAYAWSAGSAKYEKVARFVDNFFEGLVQLRKRPRHPKWREVDLTAEVTGWTRFSAAAQWLQNNPVGNATLRQLPL